MYYHVLIEPTQKTGKNGENNPYVKLDILERQDIIDNIIIPYINNIEFQFQGYFLIRNKAERIWIKQSEKSSIEIKQMINAARDNMSNDGSWIFPDANDVDVVHNDEFTQNITDEIIAEAKQKISHNDSKNAVEATHKLPKKYFISHSVKDKDYADKTIQMLEVMGVDHNDIFCTSIDGYDIDIGEGWKNRLKNELNNETFVVFLISKNFYESPISLCEMGAAWILTKKHALILVPPMEFSQLKGIINDTQAFYINEAKKWTKLKEQLGFTNNNARWEHRRDEILSTINASLQLAKTTTKAIEIPAASSQLEFENSVENETKQIDDKILSHLNMHSTRLAPLNAEQIATGTKLDSQKIWERCIFLADKGYIHESGSGYGIETCRYFT